MNKRPLEHLLDFELNFLEAKPKRNPLFFSTETYTTHLHQL